MKMQLEINFRQIEIKSKQRKSETKENNHRVLGEEIKKQGVNK